MAIPSVLLFLIYLCNQPIISQAGDYSISEFLGSSQIDPGYYYISPFLARALQPLWNIASINWWAIFSIVIYFCGNIIFLILIKDLAITRSYISLCTLFILFEVTLWYLILDEPVNFTSTATVAGLSGFIMIYYGRKNSKLTQFAVGTIFIIISYEIREEALFFSFPFMIMCVCYRPFVSEIKEVYHKENKISLRRIYTDHKNELVCMITIITIVVICLFLHHLYELSNPRLKEYIRSNTSRASISDYPDRYPDFSEQSSLYEENDIKLSWINMVMNFFTSDTNHFSLSQLTRMESFRQPSAKTLQDFIKALKRNVCLWITFALLFILPFTAYNPRKVILPLVGSWGAYTLCSAYLIYIGRFPWRVTSGFLLSGLISYYFMIVSDMDGSITIPTKNEILHYLGLVASMILLIVSVSDVVRQNRFSLPCPAITNPQKSDVLDYLDSKNDSIYLYSNSFENFTQVGNIWYSHPDKGYINNVFLLRGNFIYGFVRKLKEYGIDNLYPDMLSKPGIYVVYDPFMTSIMLDYLKDYYSYSTAVSEVDNVGNERFIRYSIPIYPTIVDQHQIINATFEETDSYSDDDAVITAYTFECDINDGQTSNYTDYHINLTDMYSLDTYSYGLAYSDRHIYGTLLRTICSWNYSDNIKIELIATTESGDQVLIGDLTDVFYNM